MSPTDESLLDLVFNRLAADQVPDQTAVLVLAAYAGEDQLRAALAGEDPDLPAPASKAATGTAPLYLESINVAGFRGIGPQVSLRLLPSPGLTLVVGRNGSGKSSFAEAAELCLTGSSPRLEDQTRVFREGWRNLHQGSPCQIQLTLRGGDGTEPIWVTRTWRDSDTDPDEATTKVSAYARHYPSVAALGWQNALETYRPFLTAGDVGRLITAKPSTLFDALAPILGLEPLTHADKRLMNARKEISDRVKQRKEAKDALRTRLAEIDDDRARAASAILAKRAPDLGALEALLARPGESDRDPVAAACRRLVSAVLPDPATVTAAVTSLADSRAETASTGSLAAQQAADLLAAALDFHTAHGDGPCPICRTGALDASWREQAGQSLADLRREAAQARAASERRAAAHAQARGLWTASGWPALPDVRTVAAALDALAAQGLSPRSGAPDGLAEQRGASVPSAVPAGVPGPAAELAVAMSAWQELGQDLSAPALAERIQATYPGLHAAFRIVQDAAAAWLQQRHDAWREPAALLETWLAESQQGVDDNAVLTRIGAARDWVKAATEEIRSARLAPFAYRSQELWEQMRQESNVELSGMQLTGTATRRRVTFPASVDGTPAQALAVMSHGELQALGLAVFLPRACAGDSPFRFLLIDDPVHSMDPAKVDGLAQVLAELARSRQVIVFTHDNRLPEAVQRLQIDATIWEVARRRESAVELRKNLDPVTRYLDDARALANTEDLPVDVRWPVVAGFCRSAIEAACDERIRRVRLGRGERHQDVDRLIDGTRVLAERLALALFEDASERGRVPQTLRNRFGGWAASVYQECQRSVHGQDGTSLALMVRNAERLAGSLR